MSNDDIFTLERNCTDVSSNTTNLIHTTSTNKYIFNHYKTNDGRDIIESTIMVPKHPWLFKFGLSSTLVNKAVASIIYEDGFIYRLHTLTQYRNNGHAKALLNESIQRMTNDKCTNIRLCSFVHLIQFYKKFGFECVSNGI